MTTLRLGVIGFGSQGRMYATLVARGEIDRMRLGAIADVDETKRAAAVELDVPVYETHTQLLDSGTVDAIVTTIPHYDHPRVAIDAIGRGIHVLVEKPVGVYAAQVEELITFASARPDVTFAVMFNQRANPLYADLQRLLASGELGALRHTTWTISTWWRPQAYFDQSPWRATWGGEGGGVLVNQAAHQLDLWQWLCGMPTSVFAKVAYGFRRAIAVDDEVNVLADFGGGATGSFITCTHDVIGTDRLEILCDRGRIVVEDSKTATITRLRAPEQELSASMGVADVAALLRGKADTTSWMTTEARTYGSAWGHQHADVLRNVASHIIDGTPLIAPGAEGVHAVRLANAIHYSSWTGEEVAVGGLDPARFLRELNIRIRAEGRYPERT